MAGVAGLPETSNINGCDAEEAPETPAKGRRNPRECRTFPELPCGWTYFVQRKDMLIKIGFSAKPRHRIGDLRREFGRSLKTLTVVPSSVAGEFETHQQFDHLRTEGEWFQPAADLWKFIRHAHKMGILAEREFAKAPTSKRPLEPTPLAKRLTAWRQQYGYNSPIGHHCSSLLEAIPNYMAASSPEQKTNLAASIERLTARLSRNLKAAA